MSQYHQLTTEQPESVKKLNLPGNTSVVLLKKQTIEVRDEPLPILQPDGVLVKVISTDKFHQSTMLENAS
jgi:D-xylulose reductase